MNKKIGISFGGTEYRGCDSRGCVECGIPLNRPWIIHDNDSGKRLFFCERHYKQWEDKRDLALLSVGAEFQSRYSAPDE